MFLCFLTAALLIAVQSRDLLTRSKGSSKLGSNPGSGAATASGSTASGSTELPDYSLPPVGSASLSTQILPAEEITSPANERIAGYSSSHAANSARQNPTPSAQPLESGLAETLTAALHPVSLLLQPELVVDLSDRRVSLYQNGVWQASYDIAVGKSGWETPTGNFKVLSMQENPTWQHPLTGETIANPAESPLGSRWIAFWTDGKHLIGFHGTNQTELIGQAVSHGCIRMRDPEIQALFTQVAIGTPVRVQE
ncbi:MAG: L,D-transpeptidase [Elainella sp. Prado103]|nr:L,D-transpeptidase [Elainella sp. Prado103]